jgi:hypothetical protein
MTYKAITKQGIEKSFETGKGNIYAVYICTKWAAKNKLDLLKVVQEESMISGELTIFDLDN